MIPIKDVNFQKIICFYLFECPARTYRPLGKNSIGAPEYSFSKVSRKGKTLAERGIEGAKVNTLRAAMIRVAGEDFVFKAGKELTSPTSEEYVLIIRSEFKTEGIFYFIRNALAHGEFAVKDGWYYFENHNKEKLKGIARIRESTLLRWIDLLNMSIEEIKETGR